MGIGAESDRGCKPAFRKLTCNRQTMKTPDSRETPAVLPLELCAIVPAPFGAVGIRTHGREVSELVYLPPGFATTTGTTSRLGERAARQVLRYLDDPDYRFDLPLQSKGTAFQQRVWQAIAMISRGNVASYGALARQLRTGPRAVGQACGANWFPLVIPCHRVVGARGIGGFGGHEEAVDAIGLASFHTRVKRWLIEHEGANVS